jgi:hypothetical protein
VPEREPKAGESGRPLNELLLDAVEKALGGDWQAAHVIVQDHDDDVRAAWIHAVVHRMEGDLENARYWYGRCGRSLREGVSSDAELREIRGAIRKGAEAER